MRRIISFNKTTEKLLLLEETKSYLYLKTATKYKEALQKAGIPLDENWSIFHLVLCWKTILIK